MADPKTEFSTPVLYKESKPYWPGENKSNPIAAKFQKAKARVTKFSEGVKRALDRTVRETPKVLFDIDLREFTRLEQNLAALNQDTAKKLGIATEEPEESIDSLPPAQRVAKALHQLEVRAKTESFRGRLAIKGILGDSDKIEGHTIDLIQKGRPFVDTTRWIQPVEGSPRAMAREGKTIATFKMTSQMAEKVRNEVIPTIPKERLTNGVYGFDSTSDQIRELSDSWVVDVDNTTRIYIAKGEKAVGERLVYHYNKPIKDSNGIIIDYENEIVHDIVYPVRALEGAVKVEVQGVVNASEAIQKINSALQTLGISEGLVVPGKQSEDDYKEARFRWQQRLEDDQAWQDFREEYVLAYGVEPVDNLERQEVFPGYSTIVDKGQAERLQKSGRIFLTHHMYSHNIDHLEAILREGLLSSHERFKRGVFTEGMSTEEDFRTGGADNVFIRAVPENAPDDSTFGEISLLFESQILDRTDWFAYGYDRYGTTDPQEFIQRPSPEQFFNQQRQHFRGNNEIMMRRGIPPEMITGIAVGNFYLKRNLIEKLRTAKINDVNGVPLEQFINVYEDFGDFKRAHGIRTASKQTLGKQPSTTVPDKVVDFATIAFKMTSNPALAEHLKGFYKGGVLTSKKPKTKL